MKTFLFIEKAANHALQGTAASRWVTFRKQILFSSCASGQVLMHRRVSG
jgi:hypothetical protein